MYVPSRKRLCNGVETKKLKANQPAEARLLTLTGALHVVANKAPLSPSLLAAHPRPELRFPLHAHVKGPTNQMSSC